MSTVSMSEVLEIKAQIAALLQRLESLTGGAPVKESAAPAAGSGKRQKKAKRQGRPTAWSAFTATLTEKCRAHNAPLSKEEKLLQPVFAKQYRDAHTAEWEQFKAEWEAAHPKSEAPAADSASDDSASEAGSAAGAEAPAPKQKRKWSEEAKASAAAKRAAKKQAAGSAAAAAEAAAKAAEPAPAAAAEASDSDSDSGSEDGEEEAELLAFKLGGKTYLRPGVKRGSGIAWASGDLWESRKGAKGDYAGLYDEETREIDASAEEPELDF